MATPDIVVVIEFTQKGDFQIVIKRFYGNYIVLNSAKCHFMCLGKNTENETYFFNNTEMEISSEEKILGITIDNKLKFKSHVKNLRKEASQKIWALSRLTNYLNDSEKKQLIFNAIIKSQFSYCPLLWMFCFRQTNNMINKLHETALKSNDISCHHRNIQMLMIELYKIKNELAPPIMDSMLNRRNITYNFRVF